MMSAVSTTLFAIVIGAGVIAGLIVLHRRYQRCQNDPDVWDAERIETFLWMIYEPHVTNDWINSVGVLFRVTLDAGMVIFDIQDNVPKYGVTIFKNRHLDAEPKLRKTLNSYVIITDPNTGQQAARRLYHLLDVASSGQVYVREDVTPVEPDTRFLLYLSNDKMITHWQLPRFLKTLKVLHRHRVLEMETNRFYSDSERAREEVEKAHAYLNKWGKEKTDRLNGRTVGGYYVDREE